jgi:hypothetical protein
MAIAQGGLYTLAKPYNINPDQLMTSSHISGIEKSKVIVLTKTIDTSKN